MKLQSINVTYKIMAVFMCGLPVHVFKSGKKQVEVYGKFNKEKVL